MRFKNLHMTRLERLASSKGLYHIDKHRLTVASLMGSRMSNLVLLTHISLSSIIVTREVVRVALTEVLSNLHKVLRLDFSEVSYFCLVCDDDIDFELL
jgi:hypothetical protein